MEATPRCGPLAVADTFGAAWAFAGCTDRYHILPPGGHRDLPPDLPLSLLRLDAETLAGLRRMVASIIDGDTIEIHGQRVRLFAIDAPESAQTCTRNGSPYRCGRMVAVCGDAGVDLGGWLRPRWPASATLAWQRSERARALSVGF